jgi:pyridoxamine 5'-phosphate oxidase
LHQAQVYDAIVPLRDDFGDWATPNDSPAGHFFAFFPGFYRQIAMEDLPPLDESTAPPTFLPLFTRWYNDALQAQLPDPDAMTLATATAEGAPSARIVLLRGYGEKGFEFYTNYSSRKGGELAANPRAALVLFWAEFCRQIRIEGHVEKVSAQQSDAYFQRRPLGHRLGALVSPQSSVIPTRSFLEMRMAKLMQEFARKEVPRPTHWGGYRVIPVSVEFWQGRENRLHDRLRYRCAENGAWMTERLAP